VIRVVGFSKELQSRFMRGAEGKRSMRINCQYRLKIGHSADRKMYHPPEKMVYSFSRLVKNRTGW
jgi:hypothetical protein